MEDWNVIVIVNEDGYRHGRRILEPYGAMAPTEYYNVVVMRVADLVGMMMDLARRIEDSPGLMNGLSRVVPATHNFNFRNAQEFEEQARRAFEIVIRLRCFHFAHRL